jgi:hypothetical protein
MELDLPRFHLQLEEMAQKIEKAVIWRAESQPKATFKQDAQIEISEVASSWASKFRCLIRPGSIYGTSAAVYVG